MTDSADRPTVMIFLLDIFSVRNFLFTPLWEELARTTGVNFVMVTQVKAHGEYVAEQGYDHISWEHLRFGTYVWDALRKLLRKPSLGNLRMVIRRIYLRIVQALRFAIHIRLIYRFNHLNDFRTQKLKRHLPAKERFRKFGEFRYLGWPFPDSWWIYDRLYRLFTAKGWPVLDRLDEIFDRHHPTLAVITYPQTIQAYAISLATCKHAVPVIAYINSWDQPTTKGPLIPGVRSVMVWNQNMRREMIAYHHFAPEQVVVVGAAHLDLYHRPGLLVDREAFLRGLGIDPAHRLVVYGTYDTRLGPDEPEIARHLAEKFAAQAYVFPATLLIRPHPKDNYWRTRFGELDTFDKVIVGRSSNFSTDLDESSADQATRDLRQLVNLMKHADLVINGPSTLSLDAIAFDTPVIHVGFDGDRNLPYEKSILFRYDYNHYAMIMTPHGTRLVNSYDELDEAIGAYLETPSLDAAGREQIRQEQLTPFDGHAGERIVSRILEALSAVQNR